MNAFQWNQKILVFFYDSFTALIFLNFFLSILFPTTLSDTEWAYFKSFCSENNFSQNMNLFKFLLKVEQVEFKIKLNFNSFIE